jgi:peptidoglycan/xylan/chitin deacetylase (PgdA/CDA1 family)
MSVRPLLLSIAFATLCAPAPKGVAPSSLGDGRVSILVYHRFGNRVADSMTIRTTTFRLQLEYLKKHDYTVIPLRAWLAWRAHIGPPPPQRSVIITADDGHRSVLTDMLPLVREFGVPVTLFIYPSAISNAAYAMTWDDLRVLKATGLFDIQSHSYWHPNFAAEKRRLAPGDYREFVRKQLTRPRAVLQQRLAVTPDVIAWPFGVYDDELLQMGASAGYTAGLTLKHRVATASDPLMALPRFLVTDAATGRQFAALLPSQSERSE